MCVVTGGTCGSNSDLEIFGLAVIFSRSPIFPTNLPLTPHASLCHRFPALMKSRKAGNAARMQCAEWLEGFALKQPKSLNTAFPEAVGRPR